MKGICFSILLSFLLLGLACKSTETEQAVARSTAADVKALRELVRQIENAASSRNLDDVMVLYADDAVEMPPDRQIVIGKEAIRSWLKPIYENYTGQIDSKVEDIQVSGDWAFQRMSYTESWTPKEGGDTTTVIGKWVLILQRQTDGSWKIATEIWNRDAPLNVGG
ncbi:MAG: YybH family protein [Candidatus Kariarchaeaceae archaeon]|jgi:uncharacterized protein (TIGR02246 family)